MKIGYSFSRCVADIAGGRVPYDDVEKIIARTAAETPEAIAVLIDDYAASAWIDFPEQAREIAQRLFDEGKVDQPRLRGEPFSLKGEFHWEDAETKQAFTTPEMEERAEVLETDRILHALFGTPARPPEPGSQ